MAVNREEFTVSVVLDSKGALKGFKDVNGQLIKFDKNAKVADKSAKKLGKTTASLGFKIISLNQAVELASKAFRGLSAAFAATGGRAVTFERAIAEVSTLITDGSLSTQQLIRDTQELQKVFGIGGEQIASGFYQAISSGAVSAAETTDVMTNALKLQIAGVTSSRLAVEAITNSLIAFGSEIQDVSTITDTFIIAMQKNKTNVEELAKAFPRVGTLAKALGAEFKETVSALASLASGSANTEEATIRLRAILAALGKTKAVAVFKTMAEDVNTAEKAIGKLGLIGTLDALVQQAGSDIKGLNAIFEDVNAKLGVLALTGGSIRDKFEETFSAMAEAAKEPGEATELAFKKMAVITDFQLKSLEQRANVAFTNIGFIIKDVAVDVIEPVVEIVESVSQGFRNLAANKEALAALGDQILHITGLITGLAVAIKGIFVGKTIIGLAASFGALVPAIVSMGASLALLAPAAGILLLLVSNAKLVKIAFQEMGNFIEQIVQEIKNQFNELLVSWADTLNTIMKIASLAQGMAPVQLIDVEQTKKDVEEGKKAMRALEKEMLDLRQQFVLLEAGGEGINFIPLKKEIEDLFETFSREGTKLGASIKAAGRDVGEAQREMVSGMMGLTDQQRLLLETFDQLRLTIADLNGDQSEFLRIQTQIKLTAIDVLETKMRENDLLGEGNEHRREALELARKLLKEQLERDLPLTIDRLIEKISEGFDDAINSTLGKMAGLPKIFEGIGDNVDKGMKVAKDSLNDLSTDLIGPKATGDLKKTFSEAGESFSKAVGKIDLGELSDAIADGVSMAADVVATIFDPKNITAAADFFQDALDFPEMVLGFVRDFDDLITTFIDEFPKAVGELIEKLPDMIASILDKLPDLVNSLLDGMSDLLDTLVQELPKIIDAIFDQLPVIIDRMVAEFPKVADMIFDALIQIIDRLPAIFDQIMEAVPGMLDKVLSRLPDLIDSIFEALPKMVTSIIRAIPRIISVIANNLGPIVESLVSGIIGAAGEIVVALIDEFILKGGIVKIVIAVIKGIVNAIVGIVKGIIGGLGRFLRALRKMLFGGADDLTVKASKTVRDLPKKMEQTLTKIADAGTKQGQQLFTLIDIEGQKKREEATKAAEEIGPRVQTAFENGVNALTAAHERSMNDLERVWLWVKEKILDPLARVVREAWMWVVEKVIQPLVGGIEKAFKWVAENIFKPFLEGVGTIFNFIGEKVFKPFGEAIFKIIAWVRENISVKKIGDGIKAAFQWVEEKIIKPLQGVGKKGFEWVEENIIRKLSVENMKKAFDKGFEGIKNFFGKIGEFIDFSKFEEKFKGLFKQATFDFEAIKKKFKEMFGGISIDNILNLESIKTKFSSTIESLNMDNLFNLESIKSKFKAMFDGLEPNNVLSKMFKVESGGQGTVEKMLKIDVPFVSFAKGGKVGGRASVAGDSEKNDKVLAFVSPGEVIVPRSVVQRPGVEEALMRMMSSPSGIPGFAGGFFQKLKENLDKAKPKTVDQLREDFRAKVQEKVVEGLKAMISGTTLRGFQDGGFVGAGGGIVHQGEFVLNRDAVGSIGVDNLQQLNRGGGAMTTNINVDQIIVNAAEGQNVNEIADEVMEQFKRRSLDGEFIMSAEGIRA